MKHPKTLAAVAAFSFLAGLAGAGMGAPALADSKTEVKPLSVAGPPAPGLDECPDNAACNGGPAPEANCDMITETDEAGNVHIEYHGTGCPPPPDPKCGQTVYWTDPAGADHQKYGGDCPEPDVKCGETVTWTDAAGKPHAKWGGECPPDVECGETAKWVDAMGKEHTKYGGDCPTTSTTIPETPPGVEFEPNYAG